MVSLQNFSTLSPCGEVPICEKHGRICTIPDTEYALHSREQPQLLPNFPDINMYRELFHSASSIRTEHRTAILPIDEPFLKKISRIFFEEGARKALATATASGNTAGPVFRHISKHLLYILNVCNRVKFFFRPHLKEHDDTDIAMYAQTREWQKSFIRHIHWHPNCLKLAVATCDDTIRIYSDKSEIVSVLKDVFQKSISSIAWRPFSSSELAVACQKGFLIWTMEKNSHNSHPLCQATQFIAKNHAPISSLAWSSNGCQLATASISDPDIYIWDVDFNRSTPLRRVGQSCSLLQWSANGSLLFSATAGNVFRVWNTVDQWTAERWTLASGFVQSAAWSPCSSYLLFVTSTDPYLFSLSFFQDHLYTDEPAQQQALPIADLSKIVVRGTSIGGQPQMIAWSASGRQLAVIFKETSSIAIFNTTITRHNLIISPSFFLNSIAVEHPSLIAFHKVNADATILTICWSSGRIQLFPFV